MREKEEFLNDLQSWREKRYRFSSLIYLFYSDLLIVHDNEVVLLFLSPEHVFLMMRDSR